MSTLEGSLCIGHPLVSWQYTWGQGTVDLARFTIGLSNVVLWGPLVEVHCNWELAALHLIIQEAKSVIRDVKHVHVYHITSSTIKVIG